MDMLPGSEAGDSVDEVIECRPSVVREVSENDFAQSVGGGFQESSTKDVLLGFGLVLSVDLIRVAVKPCRSLYSALRRESAPGASAHAWWATGYASVGQGEATMTNGTFAKPS